MPHDTLSHTLSETLAAHVADTRLADLPPSVLQAARLTMLDSLACAWAATGAPGAAEAMTMARDDGGSLEATLWGCGKRVPAAHAAFANGVAAAALDFDTVHEGAVVHADICVLPAALAIAEKVGASGAELLAALAIGNDLTIRLGRATTAHSGWFYTSIHGVFGAAAAAARLLRLDAAGIVNSLGIALGRVGGTQQHHIEHATTKRMLSAFAAQAGVESARQAAAGMTGPAAAFEGKFGFYSMYEPGEIAVVLDGLGQVYGNAEVSYKQYPACACSHAAALAAVRLAGEQDLDPDALEDIEVVITPYMNRLVGAPFEPGANPQVTAQFNVRYAVAVALLHRRFGVEDVEPAAVLEPARGALARRIRVTVAETATTRLEPATVRITAAGRRLEATVDAIPGSRKSPMTPQALREKARAGFAYGPDGLATDMIDTLIGRIERLDQLANIRDLFADLGR